MERIWERTGDDELLRWVFEALGVGRGFSLGYKIEVSSITTISSLGLELVEETF